MHLTDEAVLALLEGRLPAREAAAVHAHTAECAPCRQLVAGAARAREPSGRRAAPVPSPAPLGSEVTIPAALAPGASLGRYTILEHIGRGGMGTVYAARDPELGRRVALKVISPTSRASLPELRQRLLREAQAMAQVNHPNVVVIHEVGTVGTQVFLAMEYVEGSTLREWLAAAERSWQEVLAVFLQAGRGLAAAHAQGLVHRDFKPDNVLRGSDGRARVADFGLVRPGLDSRDSLPDVLASPLTEVGTLLGTPGYMAPEQLRGQVPDARADQFSFCVALYEALHGVRPFAGDNVLARLHHIERGALTPPSGRRQVPDLVGTVVRRGLLAEPSRRFPSMDALLAALERASQGRPARVPPQAVAVILGTAVLFAAGAWLLFPGPGKPPTAAVLPPSTPSPAAAARAESPEPAEAPAHDVLVQGPPEAVPRAVPGKATARGPEPEPGARSAETGRAALQARFAELQNRLATPAALRTLAQECAAAHEPALRSRVLVELSRALRDQGDASGTAEALRASIAAAEVAGDDDQAARAGFQLAGLMATSGSRPAEARRPALFASAAMQRVGSPPELRALQLLAHAQIALSAGRVPRAVEAEQKAVAVLEARPKPGDALLGQVLTEGGPLLQRAGRGGEAVEELREAVRVRSKALRADHPLVAESLLQLADAEVAQGDWTGAARDQARAVSILERASSGTDRRVWQARARLVELRAGPGRR